MLFCLIAFKHGEKFIMLNTPNNLIYLSSLSNRSHAHSGIPPQQCVLQVESYPNTLSFNDPECTIKALSFSFQKVIWMVCEIDPVLKGCFNCPKVVLWKVIWKFYALTPLAASQKKAFRPELQHRLSLVGKLNKILPRPIPYHLCPTVVLRTSVHQPMPPKLQKPAEPLSPPTLT